jgi:hypothetical protein
MPWQGCAIRFRSDTPDQYIDSLLRGVRKDRRQRVFLSRLPTFPTNDLLTNAANQVRLTAASRHSPTRPSLQSCRPRHADHAILLRHPTKHVLRSARPCSHLVRLLEQPLRRQTTHAHENALPQPLFHFRLILRIRRMTNLVSNRHAFLQTPFLLATRRNNHRITNPTYNSFHHA